MAFGIRKTESCLLGCIVVCIVVLGLSSDAGAAIEGVENVITQWNAVTQKIVRALALPNQIAARTYMLVHLSQYKAIQLADEANGTNPVAAAAFAGHYVLSELYPWQQSPIFDFLIDSQITPLGLSPEEEARARDIGIAFAVRFIRRRANDGSQMWTKFVPAPVGSVGKYQFTPNQTFSLYPQLAQTYPLVIDDPEQFDKLGGPLKIPSTQYNENYNISATVGNANSPLQTEFFKETAKFWEDGSNTSGIVGHLFNVSLAVTGPNITFKDTAKLFAKLSVAHYDGSIAGWYQKYKYLFWRPITAIRQGDPTHAPDATYATFLKTPAHPEYPSTHSVNGGAWLAVLADFLGVRTTARAPHGPVTVHTEGYFLPDRSFTFLRDIPAEIAISRVYGGVHFKKSADDGVKLGDKVGRYVAEFFEQVYGSL